MSTSVDKIDLGPGDAVPVEIAPADGGAQAVKARGYWEQVWLRLRRDRVAIAGGTSSSSCFSSRSSARRSPSAHLGHGPNDVNTSGGLDPSSQLPVGPWTTVTTEPYPGAPGEWNDTLYVLGADSQLGRDMFLRLLYGAQTSLEVAILATFLSVSIGLIMGLIAGFYRGTADTVVSRLTEIVMAFPYLLFVIAVAATVGQELNKITFGGLLHPGVFTLVMIFGIFGWFYPARIIRCQILSLREKEFIEAARMTGASDWRIMRSHLLPHLVAPLIVFSTLIVATNVIAEAGLSFLGLGIPAPTASWGNLLAEGPNYYLTQPWLMVWPGLAILLTTLAFNLLGDGLRDAFDPRARI